jgi:pyruvate/2-oxoglutarate dehydrogenase complex dihydrolipoamide dehydrogenase (E3) component
MPGFDDIVIGTGQAGPSLAHRLAAAGRRVAIIERHRFANRDRPCSENLKPLD